METVKLLTLHDAPTQTTGFARVAQNLLPVWHRLGAEIDCWAIGFTGWNYRSVPYVQNLFPAFLEGHWAEAQKLTLFGAQLRRGGYTHLWMMQDLFHLSDKKLPEALKEVTDALGIRTMLYFPVDGTVDGPSALKRNDEGLEVGIDWTKIIGAVDVPVAYTEFGRKEILRANPKLNREIAVLPHGVDTRIYRPLGDAAYRQELRAALWSETGQADSNWIQPGDFLMLNVNAHQRRKDVTRSLEILACLKTMGVPAKLVMHMPETSGEGVSLDAVGRQLGLIEGKDWTHHGPVFARGKSTLPESDLVKFYNAADLYLTTTLGEGWGLGITEALGCGCPVAMPLHTACGEIGNAMVRHGLADRGVTLPLEVGGVVCEWDNSRLRRRVNVRSAAEIIKAYWESGKYQARPPLSTWPGFEQWLNWESVAKAMWGMMTAEKKTARSAERGPKSQNE
jgi:glycosyltransferase involved in cell wall biosynthesis